ncbi:MAG: autotransporter domain-containing protein, partial [Bradyrhizobium sp.]
GGDGDVRVDNYCTITGNVDLGLGSNAFINHQGGVFNAYYTYVGAGNVLTNAGTLSPYGAGNIGTATIIGDLTQTATGVLAIDIDMAGGDADSIDLSGAGTASLAGKVALNFSSLAPVPQTFTILSGASDIPVQALGVLNPVVVSQISYPGDTDVELTISGFDFAPAGLNGNQTGIGGNLNAVFNAGSGGLGSILLSLANMTSLSEVESALNQLSPALYSDAQIAALYSSLGFANSLLSCKVNGTDTASIIHEGQCLWAGANAGFLDTGSTFELLGFNETAGRFAAGAQVAIAPEWRLGFGAGYQSSTLETATNASADGQLAQGGVALKYNPGAFLLAGVISG